MQHLLTAMLVLLAMYSAPPGCEIVPGNAAPADVARAGEACHAARLRFAELFGEAAPPARVVLWPRPGYRVLVDGDVGVVYWPAAPAGHPGTAWSDVLPHETMHALLTARFRVDTPPEYPGYGTPLPDWFEEGIAIWGEPAPSRATRIEQARRLPVHRRSLEPILGGQHPAASNRELYGARDGGPLTADEALWSFYPQAIGVIAFVFDAGGPTAVRELARRLAADPTDARAIVGLPGMGASLADVIRDWDRWLRH